MPATYVHFYDAFDREVLAAAWMQAEMLRRAQAGAAHAEGIAPRRTGRYADSIGADVYVRRLPGVDGKSGRAVGRVTATDPAAFQIEHGTKDTPAHRTLGRALDVMREA